MRTYNKMSYTSIIMVFLGIIFTTTMKDVIAIMGIIFIVCGALLFIASRTGKKD